MVTQYTRSDLDIFSIHYPLIVLLFLIMNPISISFQMIRLPHTLLILLLYLATLSASSSDRSENSLAPKLSDLRQSVTQNFRPKQVMQLLGMGVYITSAIL